MFYAPVNFPRCVCSCACVHLNWVVSVEISTVLQMCFQIFSNTQFVLRFFQGPICFEMSVLSDLFSAHHFLNFINFFQYTICFYFNFSKARFVFRCQISQFFFQQIICFSIFPAHNISWGPFHHSERTSANFVIFLSRHCLEFCTRAAIQYSAEQKPLCTISHFPFPPEIRCCCQPYLHNIFWLQYLWRWTNLNLNGEEEGIISIEERKITDDVTFPDQATIREVCR